MDGALLVLRADAETALDAGAAALRREHFVLGTGNIRSRLRTTGSPWIAQDLTIGRPEPRSFWRRRPDLSWDDFPFNLMPAFWPGVAPTLAIVCARPVAEGSELIVFAHPSPLRAGTRTNDTRPLVAKAYGSLQRRFGAAGTLIRHEPLTEVADLQCPASWHFVRHTLGWA